MVATHLFRYTYTGVDNLFVQHNRSAVLVADTAGRASNKFLFIAKFLALKNILLKVLTSLSG